jgi:hypothetical protein
MTQREAEGIADGLPTDLAMEVLVNAEKVLSRAHVCCVCSAHDDDDEPITQSVTQSTRLTNGFTSPAVKAIENGSPVAVKSTQNGSSIIKATTENRSPVVQKGTVNGSPALLPAAAAAADKANPGEANKLSALTTTTVKDSQAKAVRPHSLVPAVIYCLHCGDAFCLACAKVRWIFFNPFTVSCENAMTLSVPGVPASCEKFPHSSHLNF